MFRTSITVRTVLLLAMFLPIVALAQTPEPKDTTADQVVQPDISRREVRAPNIDTENYEVGLYVGMLSIEDLGSNLVYGARLAYHVTEDFFVEGVYGRSTVSDEALCNLGLCLFPTTGDQALSYYALSLGYNLFPGEVFIGKKNAMTSTFYLLAGLGSTSLVDQDYFTFNFGLGLRVLPVDWLALSVTLRDFVFQSDLLGTTKVTNNFELTAGVSVYF
jgi:outer membrane beta-barrel protein